ncbi:unnamed protein product [Dibothriocephalus latus]|uniref:Amino acid transporter n=1 Tax=Dibothriocephalus latus TaxID=60516 RepID=A0A3P6SXX5_DIBLA|nr:unnamed protein product [Dibothriocephalus latus]
MDDQESNASHLNTIMSKKKGNCFVANWFTIATIIAVLVGFGVGLRIQRMELNATEQLWLETMSESETVSTLEDEVTVPKKKKNCFVENWFMITTILGVIIGFGVGFGIQKAGLDEAGQVWLAMPGKLYIRVLQLTILPMISANVINVLADLNPKENGKVSVAALCYILGCNLISSLIGLMYGYIIQPGRGTNVGGGNDPPNYSTGQESSQISYIFRDLFLNIFPDNIVGVALFQSGTDFDAGKPNDKGEIVYPQVTLDGTNMIGVLFVSFVFGLATNHAKEKGIPFKKFFNSLGDVVMLLMQKFLLIVSLPKCFVACDQYGIPKSISRFVLPFAGTMKSDASAIFIVGSCFFIAQMQQITLDAGKVVIIVILATAYVTALPNIPSASVVAVITILNSIGVDSKLSSLLFAVEWLNDRLRSGNVALSHMYCTTFVYHVCKKSLPEEKDEDEDDDDEDEDDDDDEKKKGGEYENARSSSIKKASIA